MVKSRKRLEQEIEVLKHTVSEQKHTIENLQTALDYKNLVSAAGGEDKFPAPKDWRCNFCKYKVKHQDGCGGFITMCVFGSPCENFTVSL